MHSNFPPRVPSVTVFSPNTHYNRPTRGTLGDQSMRLFLACAIIITATIGLGGCFGHHEKAVATEPLKLG